MCHAALPKGHVCRRDNGDGASAESASLQAVALGECETTTQASSGRFAWDRNQSRNRLPKFARNDRLDEVRLRAC